MSFSRHNYSQYKLWQLDQQFSSSWWWRCNLFHVVFSRLSSTGGIRFGENTCICFYGANWFNFWHLTPIFVNLFVGCRHLLLVSLRTPAAVGLASETEAVFTCDHVILTFDLSTCKCGHGSPPIGFSRANFHLTMPFRSRLTVIYGTDGQTDRQTDDSRHSHQRLMPLSYMGAWA